MKVFKTKNQNPSPNVEEKTEALVDSGVLLVAAIIRLFLRPLVFMQLWNWHVPRILGLPTVNSYWTAWGLAIILTWFSVSESPKKKPNEMFSSVTGQIIGTCLIWAGGWVIHLMVQ